MNYTTAMRNTEPSIKAVRNSQNQGQRLELAEYASLIASGVGTIVAAVSGQVVYAAAPLTLALSLNMVNRQRFLAQTKAIEQSTSAAISLLEHELRGDIQSVRSSSQITPASERLRDLEASMLRLSTLWVQLQQRLERSSASLQDPQIQQEFAIVRRAIVRLRDSTNVNIAEVRQSLAEEIESLRQMVRQPAQQAELSTATSQLTPADEVPAQIAQLQQRVEQLELKNQEIVKPYIKRLVMEVKQLQQQSDTEPIKTALADLSVQIENLAKELEAQIDPHQMQGMHSALSRLSENIAERHRVPGIEPQPVRSIET